jgi:ethanolamine ammonia-lyase small subunit
VHAAFDAEELAARLRPLGVETLVLQSAATSRQEYLQRPDRGRELNEGSRGLLANQALQLPRPELVILISDGLSALAAERQAIPLLESLLPLLHDANWQLAPVVLIHQARVALEDEVGYRLGAELALILLGERPGLGAPDSLGAYLVYKPGPHLTDARRNCVSNIRPEGLPPAAAAQTLFYLLTEARRRKLSGIDLKDERFPASLPQSGKLS